MRDSKQLETLFAAYGAALVLYARQWLPTAAAEDAVQDAFIRLLRLAMWPDNVRAWLFQVVRNRAIDQARAGLRRQTRELRAARTRHDWFEPRPEDTIDAKFAQRALESLPLDQREVVVMRIWGQMTLAAIADVTGEATSTVFSRYQAALSAVREIMEMESSCSTKDKKKKVAIASHDCATRK